MSSKELAFDPYAAAAPKSSPSFGPFGALYSRFSQWRENLNLPSPGTVEHLQKEVKGTQVSSVFSEGGRADMTKTLSMDPIFQVVHGFSLGSSSPQNPSMYSFGAVYGTNDLFAQGTVDHEGNLNGRLNKSYNERHTLKLQGQLVNQASHNMFSVEHDYQGRDNSVNLKAINVWPFDLSGMYVGSYIQSFTKNLALGVETMYQRQTPELTDLVTSYIGKYTGADRNWIAATVIQPAGMVQASYWQRLSEKVEVSAELQLVSHMQRREALATLATKYDLRLSSFRAQLDSTGKVSAWLEQRFSPAFIFSVGGEIDHFKNTSKIGVGVQIESSSMMPEDFDPSLLPQ